MNRGVSGCATTALLMFVSLAGEITEAADVAENGERGFYVGASASRVEQDARGEGQMIVSVGWPFGFAIMLQPDRVDIDDTQAGWNVTLGYRVNEYLAAELAYYDFGEASVVERYSPGIFPLPDEITVRSNIEAYGPGLSLLGTLPLTASVDLFARGGVLFLDQEVENRISSFRYARRTGEEIWMAGAGAQWSVTSRWTARLEYQLTDTVARDRSILPSPAGTRKVDQVSLGVLFHF